MANISIPLGSQDRLEQLYSYPNIPGSDASLADTILHWFNQTLERDGFAAQGAQASIRIESGDYHLDLMGPAEMAAYRERLPVFLDHGWAALDVTHTLQQPSSKPDTPWPDWLEGAENRIWDPLNTGRWRFFLSHGMAMINQKSVQFFHYPPLRLLDPMQDYLDDPVPVRLIELLKANGVASEQEAWLHSVVMDGAPIAAPDDQGTIYKPGDWHTAVHLLPIRHYSVYQRAQVELLLNINPVDDAYTIPIVVYGTSARKVFSELYNVQLRTNHAYSVEVIPGKTTPVLSSGHPYAFFAQVQGEVGSGAILPGKEEQAMTTMTTDLIVARWQMLMGEDSTQDPQCVLQDCKDYWQSPEQQAIVCELVMHQGSLFYPDANSLKFTFTMSNTDAIKRCTENDNKPIAEG